MMLHLSRRRFLLLGATALAARGDIVQLADDILLHPSRSIQALERKRVLNAAQQYLRESPRTIVAAEAPRSAGGLHDYYSEADYFWPDPKNPDGPYINRDGESNPGNFNTHRELLIRLSIQVPALVAAWVLTRRRDFAEHAAAHLRAWFVTPETRMNPNLKYAQAVHGISKGRSWGIIDTVHLVEVAQSAIILQRDAVLSQSDWQGTRRWFEEYLEWLNSSDAGRQEREAKNNHGSCWILQAIVFARLVGNSEVPAAGSDRLKRVVYPEQIAMNGSFPLELARTKPYGYSLFNLDILGMAAHVLSETSDNLWTYKLADGRGLANCFHFMMPYIEDKNHWPYRHDVQYFDDLPVRQPSLLFAGLAYRDRTCLDLWSQLDPDPTVHEVIRNHPIRQPILWM